MVSTPQIIKILKQRHIPYKLVHHPAVYTATQADQYVQGEQFIRTKNLFLTSSHHQFFLVLLREDKRLDSHYFRQISHTSRISFASTNKLKELLDLIPGAVSPFGLLNNERHNVTLYIDKDVASAPNIGCHPNDNTATIILPTQDLLQLLLAYGYPTHLF